MSSTARKKARSASRTRTLPRGSGGRESRQQTSHPFRQITVIRSASAARMRSHCAGSDPVKWLQQVITACTSKARTASAKDAVVNTTSGDAMSR